MSALAPATPQRPAGVALVHELSGGQFPLHVHPEWQAAFPWLVQGTTGRGEGGLDMGLFGAAPTGLVQDRWRRLRAVTGMDAAVHARQVHGASVYWHEQAPPGLTLLDDRDGHATARPGILLTVSVADCVPIFLLAPRVRAVALLHGGWRGLAAGILERGVALLAERTGAGPGELHLHCGPAICGGCYEVGAEVITGLGIQPAAAPAQLDLRAVVAARALAVGLPPRHVTLSGHCTRCGDGAFWSHRGGCRERQVAVAGMLA